MDIKGIKLFKIIFILIIFLGGMYFYGKYANSKLLEGLTTMNGELRCPDILIQKGSKYYLYNSNIAEVPGVNPIVFNNLEEYVEFMEWQRGAGIMCPVLYVQNSYDIQGNRVYKIRPSVTEPQGGLPPSVLSKNIQKQMPSPLDETNLPSSPEEYNKGPLDNSSENLFYGQADAMNPNWAGEEYTQSLIDAGYYKGNEVDIAIPP